MTKPSPTTNTNHSFDVVVLGAGPGGYVAAIRASQLGMKTAVIEREFLGGVCLNVGCIPSKALISAAHFYTRMQHDAAEMGIRLAKGSLADSISIDVTQLQKWKSSVCERMSGGVAQLLKGNQVTVFRGEARLTSAQSLQLSTGEKIQAKNIILANGSRPISIPGFEIDEKRVLSSTGALALSEIPKNLVVIGGGYIGLELGSMWAQLGSHVTVLEAQKSLLAGVADPECVQVVQRKLKKLGIQVELEAKAKSWSAKDSTVTAVMASGEEKRLAADYVLVTVGRRPNSDQAGIRELGLRLDSKGFIAVDAQRRTSIPNIYAIGDIAGQPMLAHKASYEGILAAEVIAGHPRAYDAKTVPAVIFVEPEMASAGWTEEECRAAGHKDLKIGKFPFAANGRAVSLMETEGFVKVIADAKTHVVLGIHIVGPEASQLISEAVLAIEMGARLEDLALSIHPHPTLGETMMEAAEVALGHGIHILKR